MRIISGEFKGRSINYIKNLNTRPLKDSVKESIFNIIEHSNYIKTVIKNSNILDLYSGVGSFGIECISRGSKCVTFVEQDQLAAKILKNNLNKFMITNKSRIYNNKIENFLTLDVKDKFDILFFDPPFADAYFIKNIQYLRLKKIFSKNHILIIHREEKSEDNLENLIKIVDLKKYGRSKIIFGIFK